MSLETKQAQLTSVQAAIAAIESGAQSFTVLGRMWQKADLKVLYEREQKLETDIEKLTRGGIRMRLGVPTSR